MKTKLLTLLTALSIITLGLPIAQAPAQEAEIPADVARAGVAVVDATWHVGSSAGQHATEGRDTEELDPHSHSFKTVKSYGVQSRLSVRAIVVEGSNDERVALVKTDNYLAQDYLQRRVGQILEGGESGIGYDDILLSASHNHSSPYHLTPAVGPWIFTDAFDLRMFEYQSRQIAQAIERAAADMAPVQMGAATVQHSIFKGNVPGYNTAEDGTPAGFPRKYGDYSLVVLRFDSLDPDVPIGTIDGRQVNKAVWMNFGEHPESLDGYDLLTADFLGPLERFVERETGAPVLFTQGDVGSAEGPGDEWRVNADGTVEAWYHRGFANAERGARYLADSVVEGFDRIGSGDAEVNFTSQFPVGVYSAWIPGPLSHPYPGYGNCRTEKTVEGSPGSPTAPDCERTPNSPPPQSQMVWDSLKAHGLPVPAGLPENYSAPAFMGVEENLRLRLQAVRLGDVILGSCSCESQVDLIKNFESRVDDIVGNIHDGYQWDCTPNAPITDPSTDVPWTCQDFAEPSGTRTATFSENEWKRALAQIHNDADGWDDEENVAKAESEPADITQIWGNFTWEEMGDGEIASGPRPNEAGSTSADASDILPVDGYKIAVGMGHTGDYLGYTVSYREYMRGDHYRKSLTSYGPHTADYMNTRLVWMAAALKDGDNGVVDFANPLETDPYYQVQLADEARQEASARFLGQASSNAYRAWMSALPDDVGPAKPLTQRLDDIERFDAALFTWRGGSNAVDNPTVIVQRKVDGEWQFFADQTGEVQTFLDFPDGVQGVADTYTDSQEWKWTANFEAFDWGPLPKPDSPVQPVKQVPTGEYRFYVKGQIRDLSENRPYEFPSAAFTVSPWSGIKVKNLNVAEDGTVSFDVTGVEEGQRRTNTPNQPDYPIRYPRTYTSNIPFIEDDNQANVCRTCSFRPWAIGSTVESAVVTVVGPAETRTVSANCDISGSCKTTDPVYADETAFVASGGVVDNYGETNGTATSEVQGTRPRPIQTPIVTTLTFTDRSAGSGQFSDSALIETQLTEEDGTTPIAGVEVEFEFIQTGDSWKATTDEEGIASKTITLSQQPNHYDIAARYAGSEDYVASANMASFVVEKEDSAMTLSAQTEGGKGAKGKGGNANAVRTLSAQLSDADTTDNRVVEAVVQFFAGTSLMGEAVTDRNGVATFNVSNRYKNSRSYEARFAGNEFYEASSASR